MNRPLQQELHGNSAEGVRPGADALRPDYVIDVRRVRLQRDDFRLDIENLRILRGSQTAILGRNGAGKSTFMEALLGLVKADMEGEVFGLDLRHWAEDIAVRRRIGVQLQAVSYPGSVRVSDLVTLHDHLYGRKDPAVARVLNLQPLMRKAYRALSRGQKQRVDLYMAMAHVPELLLLDEPCTGLDRKFLEETIQLIGSQAGQTLLMICHTPEELAAATDILWMRAGVLTRHDAKKKLMREYVAEYRLEARPREPQTIPALLERLRHGKGVVRCEQTAEGSVVVFGDISLQALARSLIEDPSMESCAFGACSGADFLRLVTESREYE